MRGRKKAIGKRGKDCCWDCRQLLPNNSTRTRCNDCRLKGAASRKKRYDLLRQTKRCVTCGSSETLIDGSHVHCEICYLKNTARMHLGSRTRWIELRSLWEQQKGTCPYTGARLQFGIDASIDHVLPQSRYPELKSDLSNLEWVHISINIMKRNSTKEEFLNIIKDIHDYTSSNERKETNGESRP